MGTYPAGRSTETTVLSALTTTPAVQRPAPIATSEPGRDDRLLIGLGASANNSQGRPFDPNLSDWAGS